MKMRLEPGANLVSLPADAVKNIQKIRYAKMDFDGGFGRLRRRWGYRVQPSIPESCELILPVFIQPTTSSPILKRPRQPNIPRACTHKHIERPSRHLPRLTCHIPVAQILPANVESDSTRSARHQVHLLETAQLLRRRSWSTGRQTEIELSDFGASHGAVVCNFRGTVATVSKRPTAPPGPGAVLPAVLSV